MYYVILLNIYSIVILLVLAKWTSIRVFSFKIAEKYEITVTYII